MELFTSPDGINWENSSKATFAYYASGDLKTYTTYQGLINNQWKASDKKSFLYGNGLRTQETRVKWDDVTNDWETHPDYRYDYTYNHNDLCDTATYSQWTSSSSSLRVYNKETYQYDVNGFITERMSHDDNNTAHIMRPSYRRVYSYNYSYPKEATGYRWNDGTSSFKQETHWDFTFSGELLKRIDAQTWDEISGSWEPEPHPWFGRKTTFYYEPIDEEGGGAGIHVAQQMAFKVYPNPASDKLTVQLTEGTINHLQITNVTGQVVFESNTALSARLVTLPVSQLTPGVYYLQVLSGAQKATKAFVVE